MFLFLQLSVCRVCGVSEVKIYLRKKGLHEIHVDIMRLERCMTVHYTRQS